MRNEHTYCRWNNSNRYHVFDEKKYFFFSLSHIHLTFGSCYQYSLNAWLLDKNISSLFHSFSYQFVLIFVFIVLVDFNSNTNNKTTPFTHHLFSTNSFLNYTKSDRRTSSPIDHHKEIEEEEEEEEEEEDNNNEEIGTDENDDDLDEDSCNR
jgi:hypothetical protein